MKRKLLIALLIFSVINTNAQLKNLYFGIGPEVMFTASDPNPSAIEIGLLPQLSYYVNEKVIIVVSSGFKKFINLGDINALRNGERFYSAVPLLAGLEYNFSNSVYGQVKAGNSFLMKVKDNNEYGQFKGNINNVFTYELAFGIRLSEHSDILLKYNHMSINVRNIRTNANNKAIGFAYIYNL